MTSMTLDPPLTNLLPPDAELVAGVDTHKNTHHVAILDLVGRPVADREFRADGRGYAQIVTFLHAHGDVVRVGVEGTGSYGAGLARALTAAGLTVVEVARQDRQARRRRGKSDPLDARQAAVAVLAGTDTAIPKSGDGAVESMRILLAERRSAAKAKGASDEPDPCATDHSPRARATGVPGAQWAASGEHARQNPSRDNHVPRS